MKRVVVTGMGIVSSIGNKTQEVLAVAPRGALGDRARREICRARLPLPGARRADARHREHDRPQGGALHGRRHGLELRRHEPGDPGRWPRAERRLERAHRPDHGLGRTLDAGHRRVGRHRAHQGAAAGRAVRGAEGDVLDQLGDARHVVQDQGRQLFDLVGLRHVQPLHRQCLRDHPARQAGHHLRRRRRGARLDALGALRRHGRDVEPFQRPPGGRLARLRQEPRRLRHRRRRRRRRARGARARQGARRPHLWRDRRLRRHLGRLRHGAALRRRRRALHEDGAQRASASRSTTSTRTPPRRRSATSTEMRGDSGRCSAATSARRSRRPSR